MIEHGTPQEVRPLRQQRPRAGADPAMSTDARRTQNDTDDRPDDCLCKPSDDLECFPCHLAGFDSVNPNGTGRTEDA